MSDHLDLMLAAILDCPHEIEANSIVLKADPKRPGHNALRQLSMRIQAVRASEKDRSAEICADRSREHHREARRYAEAGDVASQTVCLEQAVEAMDCALAIRRAGR